MGEAAKVSGQRQSNKLSIAVAEDLSGKYTAVCVSLFVSKSN